LVHLLERYHGSDFIVPEVIFHQHVFILAVFLDFSKYVSTKYFVELLSCLLVACFNLLLLLALKWGQGLLIYLVLDGLAIVLDVLCSLIDTLEEAHHVPEPDVILHFINVLKNLVGLDFALDGKSDFWFIHLEFLFVTVHPFLSSVPICTGVFPLFYFEEYICFDFDDIFDKLRNDLSELVYTFP